MIFLSMMLLFYIFPSGKSNDRSSYSTSPEGSKGAFLLCRETGFSVERWELPLEDLSDIRGVLIVSEPKINLTDREIFILKKWVAPGNTLVFLSSHDNNFFGDLNIKVEMSASSGLFQPIQPSSLTEGVRNIQVPSLARLQSDLFCVVEIFGDPAGGIMITFPLGEGFVVLLSDPDLISNKSIGKLDNPVLFINTLKLYTPPGGKIYFDDYHHGYGYVSKEADNLISWLPLYVKVILIQIIFTLIVFFFARGLPFGKPHPPESPQLRSSTEFIISMANLFRRAEARGEIILDIYENFKRGFIRKNIIKVSEDDREIARKISQRADLPSEPLLKLIKKAQVQKRNITEKEMFDWYREIMKYK